MSCTATRGTGERELEGERSPERERAETRARRLASACVAVARCVRSLTSVSDASRAHAHGTRVKALERRLTVTSTMTSPVDSRSAFSSALFQAFYIVIYRLLR